jgi:uroporphyrinogen-III synthase
MREIPLEENPHAFAFGEQLVAGFCDMLIVLTGVGLKTLINVLHTRFPLESIKAALNQTTLVARGPKPIVVLKELGLAPQITVPEPNTWRDLLKAVDEGKPDGIQGLQIAVQEYGVSNPDLLDALRQRGATVTQVPVYRWALPEDTGPLRQVLDAILGGQVDVMLITNAAQVEHIMQVLGDYHQVEEFQKSLTRIMVGSIGQIASERLRHYELPVDLEPSHPKMGILVKEASQYAGDCLKKKGTTT